MRHKFSQEKRCCYQTTGFHWKFLIVSCIVFLMALYFEGRPSLLLNVVPSLSFSTLTLVLVVSFVCVLTAVTNIVFDTAIHVFQCVKGKFMTINNPKNNDLLKTRGEKNK